MFQEFNTLELTFCVEFLIMFITTDGQISSSSSSFLPSLHSSSSSAGGHRGEAGSAEAAAEHVQQGLGEDEEYEEQEEWTKLE